MCFTRMKVILTKREYRRILQISEVYITEFDQRVGQAIINAISDIKPKVAGEIANGTRLNCYYTDENLKRLIQYLHKISE